MISNANDFVKLFEPSSKVKIGIGGYDLDVRLKEEVLQEADVPEFPVEDGSVLQDHIIIKPVTITITGDVSDIHIRPTFNKFSGVLSRLDSLTDTASVYLPGKTSSQLRKIRNIANKVNADVRGFQNLLNRGASLFDLVDDNPTSNTQDFYDKLSTAYKTRQAISVTTPFRTYSNMVIISLTTTTDNEATSLGYEVKFKEIKIAVDRSILFNIGNPATENKIAEPLDTGSAAGPSEFLPQPAEKTTPLTAIDYINRGSLTQE